MICDGEGNELAAGEEGEVWLRTARDRPTYRYIGATARRREGGWESLGDVGWLDEDNYLYLGDRLEDMILTGGANVYPAEVEAAMQEHPDIKSVAVIGLPDDDLGNIVHAIVEADPETVAARRISWPSHPNGLTRYKVPRSIEYTDQPLRNEAGKAPSERLARRAGGVGELETIEPVQEGREGGNETHEGQQATFPPS